VIAKAAAHNIVNVVGIIDAEEVFEHLRLSAG
jgi:hypothetical protein